MTILDPSWLFQKLFNIFKVLNITIKSTYFTFETRTRKVQYVRKIPDIESETSVSPDMLNTFPDS